MDELIWRSIWGDKSKQVGQVIERELAHLVEKSQREHITAILDLYWLQQTPLDPNWHMNKSEIPKVVSEYFNALHDIYPTQAYKNRAITRLRGCLISLQKSNLLCLSPIPFCTKDTLETPLSISDHASDLWPQVWQSKSNDAERALQIMLNKETGIPQQAAIELCDDIITFTSVSNCPTSEKWLNSPDHITQGVDHFNEKLLSEYNNSNIDWSIAKERSANFYKALHYLQEFQAISQVPITKIDRKPRKQRIKSTPDSSFLSKADCVAWQSMWGNHADKVEEKLNKSTSNLGRSAQRRVIRTFLQLKEMSEFDLPNEWYTDSDFVARLYSFHLSKLLHLHNQEDGIAWGTLTTDYNALRRYSIQLQSAELLAKAPLIKLSERSNYIFDTRKTNQLLGSLCMTDIAQGISAREAEVVTVDTFLSEVQTHLQTQYDHVLKTARKILKEGLIDFHNGRKMADRNIDHIMRTPDHLDRTKAKNRSPISFFNKNHPEGLENLVAYLAQEREHQARQRSFIGEHHIDEWGYEYVRRHLGLTPLVAVAAQAIIIGDDGVNADSLHNTQLTSTPGGEGVFTNHNGELTITYKKLRARTFLTKPLGSLPSKDLASIPEEEIDSAVALAAVLEMTRPYREYTGLSHLFLVDQGGVENYESTAVPLSIQSRRSAWKRLVNELTEAVSLCNPTLKKLRVTGGVLEWFNTGGDIGAVAHRLGNTIGTALRSYIPLPLREAVYRKQIRRFQNVLLVAAIKDQSYATSVTGLHQTDLDGFMSELLEYQKRMQTHSELAELLFGKELASGSYYTSETVQPYITFVMSLNNIALCYALSKSQNLMYKSLALSVLHKIRNEGTRSQVRFLKLGISLGEKLKTSNLEIAPLERISETI
jgi:hypothetical protein